MGVEFRHGGGDMDGHHHPSRRQPTGLRHLVANDLELGIGNQVDGVEMHQPPDRRVPDIGRIQRIGHDHRGQENGDTRNCPEPQGGGGPSDHRSHQRHDPDPAPHEGGDGKPVRIRPAEVQDHIGGQGDDDAGRNPNHQLPPPTSRPPADHGQKRNQGHPDDDQRQPP